MKALIIASLMLASTATQAAGEIVLWGEGATPPPAASQTTEAPKPQAEAQKPAEKPASPLDHIDAAIDTVNRIDRQGQEIKRLFGK